MLEGSGISPFSQRGLDEAFGFAVGLRGVRLNPDVLDSELFASAGEGFGEVAATIVSHDAFDGNAEAPEVGDGGDQERDGAFFWSGKISARAIREWSSITTWTNSQPAP